MTQKINALAGKPAPSSMLVDVPKLITAYYSNVPDPAIPNQRVLFGTSGHRGSSFDTSFNEWHILAISQAICLYRTQHDINGPLFLGFDTHALSAPAFASALEVLAANNVEVMIAERDEYTPTPVISHAILTYNQNRKDGFADGIVISPSHNPPQDGGFKYNSINGGPADVEITKWIEKKANEIISDKLKSVKRIMFERAKHADTTHQFDYLNHYVNDLDSVINMNVIRDAHIHLGVDPLGGAGVHYWHPIADRYQLDLTVVNETVDPTFRFMTVDWDGQIRMDPSSPYAMASLLKLKDSFDLAFACDTDHDRHGIVTRKAGLLPPNHYLAAAIFYLFQNRPQWQTAKGVGKTIVSSQMINWIATKLGHSVYEVPVGFKWFVEGLLDGSLGFCGEESAGASLSRLNGQVWTTDKDGIVLALLSAEITASLKCDIGDLYQQFETEFGKTFYQQDDANATLQQKLILQNLTPQQISATQLAGEKITTVLTTAPGNNAPINGLKIMTKSGWLVIRPSGTEDIYRVYAESFNSNEHLKRIIDEGHTIVNSILKTVTM
jgi:phosphoglucomutase